MSNLRRKVPSSSSLFVFEAAARCGSFTRAADELCVSQPAVSRMLSRLEEHLGVQLFERVHGGARLTESGSILYRRVQEGFSTIESAISEIEARATGIETVTLSVSTAFTTHWLMPRMSRFSQRFPTVDMRYQLMSGRIGGPLVDVDLGMRYLEAGSLKATDTLVIPEITLPVCNAQYLADVVQGKAKKQVPTLISMDNQDRGWAAAFETPGRADNALVFSDYAVVVQAALLGQGMALGWLNVVSNSLCKGELVPATDSFRVNSRRCCLVVPANRPVRPIVESVRDWIIEEMREDMLRIDALYPHLGLLAVLESSH
ncbi:Glycine cleavage system transcriptional activator [Pseudomonas extremaustralis]|uniref:Glycine cleavage system transcriptional activator n=1 Tax=Pseudomonas extremaustralis TaxID=359110 RepID=A0A5M9J0K2_9PSED|nr:LysR family transcriptional regulator [Pseudomonas extremaustralis]KAA8561943.1 Glycine cleavage system transcriptional activator [Pseudomonas extremaustralis]